jgi:hypothetical protein
MKTKNLNLSYDVSLEKGSTWKPLKVQFIAQKDLGPKLAPTEPFKYMADALVGLSLLKLNHFLKSPLAHPELDYSLASEAFKALNPLCELYDRSQPRVRALQSHLRMTGPGVCTEFESHFQETLENAIKPWGIDLSALGTLLDTFNWVESKMGAPLLYNFSLNFSKPFVEKMHILYSFLYHLRSLVAIDHNAHCEDPSHEAVKVDAISDYISKPEYVANDAILYWNFKKLSQPFAGSRTSDARVEKLFVNPLEKSFQKYSHNAYQLVNSLPPTFLNSLNPIELEEALHLVQMDWLLGSPSGLMFRIREELYGLQNGYEKIFWNDVEPKNHSKPFKLSLSCKVTPEHFNSNKAA